MKNYLYFVNKNENKIDLKIEEGLKFIYHKRRELGFINGELPNKIKQ